MTKFELHNQIFLKILICIREMGVSLHRNISRKFLKFCVQKTIWLEKFELMRIYTQEV